MKSIFLFFGCILLNVNAYAQWTALPNALGPYSGPNACMISLTIPNVIQPVANGKILYTTDCQKTASSGGEVFIQLSTDDMFSMQIKHTASGLGCCPVYNMSSFNDSTFSYIQSQSGISIVKFTNNNLSSISNLNNYSMPSGKATCITPNFVYSLFQMSGSDSMRTFRATQTGIAMPKKTNFLYNVIPDKLQFFNDSVGFTLANFKSNTSKTALLRTLNYGSTWLPVLVDSINPISDYHILPSGYIYLSRQDGNVTGSTNFGASWTPLGSAPAGNYFAIRFVNDSVGFIGGASGTLFKTINYGISWTAEISNTTQQINQIFSFGNVAYFTDATKKVFKNQNILASVHSVFIETSSSLNIYPNPFNAKITIVTSASEQQINIYNVFGQVVYTDPSSLKTKHQAEIDLKQLPSGIYFVRIGSVTRKIIKE